MTDVTDVTDLDRAADRAVTDLRRLTAVWREGGDAALDAAVRADADLTFAVLDARAGGGMLRLVAARLSQTPPLVLSFAVGARRLVVLRGGRCVLHAGPELDDVTVGPRDEPLAMELAWRLSVGMEESARLPVEFDAAPEGFRDRTAVFTDVGLLGALRAARSMLDGGLPFLDGARQVHCGLGDAGVEPTPHALYVIHHEVYEIGAGRPDDAEHSREQQRAELEAWSRVHGRADCEALLARFQGAAFAGAHG